MKAENTELKSMMKARSDKELEDYRKNKENMGNTKRGPFSHGGTRRIKNNVRKTRKNNDEDSVNVKVLPKKGIKRQNGFKNPLRR
jgi:hypothetical protein